MRPRLPGGRLALVAAAVAAVVLAPLAPSTTSANLVTIAGARTLSDTVSVDFAARPARTTDIHLIAFNDFHGNLEPAGLNIYGRFAGGAAYLAKAVADKQAQYRREVTLFAGDNIGAAPLVNSLFNEEPAVIVSNAMHVDVASVGNHEFDKGATELQRIQKGGCAPTGCLGAPYYIGPRRTSNVYPGANYPYLSTNVVAESNGKPLLSKTYTKTFLTDSFPFRPVRVGFIGETLQATPTIVTPAGVAGLKFLDEADAANAALTDLKRQGVTVPILVVHQGGLQSPAPTTVNGCAGNLAGSDIEKIIQKLDPAIRIIVSAHTHAEYRCTITTNGVTRLVTSASSFGRILSDIRLTVDDRTGYLVGADASNSIVENATNPYVSGATRVDDPTKSDPTVAKIVSQYVTGAAPLANKVIGSIQGDLNRAPTGESTLGDVIADSQLAATTTSGQAQIAFMNPGGIRADLHVADISSGGEAPGQVTFGEAFTVQPFGNSLVTKTMTGAQIRSLLQQQYAGCGGQITAKTLQISKGFSYQAKSAALPATPTPEQCAAQIGTISLNGTPIADGTTYRATMNNFLASGGDGFTVFNAGTDALGGGQDIDAFVAAFTAAGATGIAVPPLDRVVPTG